MVCPLSRIFRMPLRLSAVNVSWTFLVFSTSSMEKLTFRKFLSNTPLRTLIAGNNAISSTLVVWETYTLGNGLSATSLDASTRPRLAWKMVLCAQSGRVPVPDPVHLPEFPGLTEDSPSNSLRSAGGRKIIQKIIIRVIMPTSTAALDPRGPPAPFFCIMSPK